VKNTERSNMKSFHRRNNQSEDSSLQKIDAERDMTQFYKTVGIKKISNDCSSSFLLHELEASF